MLALDRFLEGLRLNTRLKDFVWLAQQASRSKEPHIVVGVYNQTATFARAITVLADNMLGVWTSSNSTSARAAWMHPPVTTVFLVPKSSLRSLRSVDPSYLVDVVWLEDRAPKGLPLVLSALVSARTRVFIGDRVVQPSKARGRSTILKPGTANLVVPSLQGDTT